MEQKDLTGLQVFGAITALVLFTAYGYAVALTTSMTLFVLCFMIPPLATVTGVIALIAKLFTI